jgi:hypothetical protein
MLTRRTFFIIIFLLLAGLACSTGSEAIPSTASSDSVGTVVAATLTSVAAGDIGGSGTTTAPVGGVPAPGSSPGAIRVVFEKDGDVFLWIEGGGTHQLTSSGNAREVRISDDGQVVAFRRGDTLWAVNADGSNARELVSAAYLASLKPPEGGLVQLYSYAFIPRSHRLFFVTGIATEAYFVASYDLHGVDADNPAPVRYAAPDQGGLPAFSPDGSLALLLTPEKVSVINADGSGLHGVFTFPLVSTYSEWFYIPPVAWINDLSGFKIVLPPADALGDPSAKTRLLYVSLTGISAQVAEFLAAPVFMSQPQLSPDSDRVAYLRQAGDNLELHVVDSSGADTLYTSYAKDKFGLIGWAPDSLGFVYWADDKRTPWLAHLGAAAVPLSDVAYAANMRWIDKDRILFLNGGELRLRFIGAPSVLIDGGLSAADFDFDY